MRHITRTLPCKYARDRSGSAHLDVPSVARANRQERGGQSRFADLSHLVLAAELGPVVIGISQRLLTRLRVEMLPNFGLRKTPPR